MPIQSVAADRSGWARKHTIHFREILKKKHLNRLLKTFSGKISVRLRVKTKFYSYALIHTLIAR